MCHTNNEKQQMTPDRRKETTKSRKNYNAWRKGNLQILVDLEADTIKHIEMKEKN